MKKLIPILSVLLILALMAGCTNDSVTPAGTTASPAATDKPTQAPDVTAAPDDGNDMEADMPLVDEPITLTVWGNEVVDNDYATNATTTAYEEMTGVHIEWDLYSTSVSGSEAFNLMIAGNEFPDIIGTSFSTDQVSMCIEGSIMMPLNDLIDQYGKYYQIALEEQPQYRDLLTAPDGNIYTFFYTDVGVHKDSEYKMWVYTDWLTKLNMDVPTTTEQFKDMILAFRDNDPNGNGVADELPLVGFYNGRKSDPICYLMNPFQLYNDNYFYISDAGKVQFIANTDGWRDGLIYLNDLYENGLILEETYVQDMEQFKALINKPAGETIVGVFPFWYQGQLIDTSVLNWTDYQAIAPLVGPTGLQQTAARKGGDFRLCSAISTQCEYPEIAFKWLDWMLGDEGLLFGQFGVEGVTYEWVDVPAFSGADKSIKTVDGAQSTMIWNSSQFPRYDKAEVRYATSYDEAQQNTNNTYILYSAAQIYAPYYVYHNVPQIVWSNDTDLITSITDYRTLFNDYIAASYTAFIMGNDDINDDQAWQDYLDTLDSMGLQDYLDCLTRYYS